MARKKLFDSLAGSDGESPTAAPPPRQVRAASDIPTTQPMRTMRSSLRDLQQSSVQEIPVDQIAESVIRDRIDLQEGIEDLVSSFRELGQEVPIKVRVSGGDLPYEIVVGRRRLAAARALGWQTVRGFVVKITDEELLAALGSENAARLDTSFVGRAQLAYLSIEEGYSQETVGRSLNVSQTLVNFMLSVYRGIGPQVIKAIGDAPGIGRGKWQALHKLIDKSGMDDHSILALLEQEMKRSFKASKPRSNGGEDLEEHSIPLSTKRFEVLLKAMKGREGGVAMARHATPARTRPLPGGIGRAVRKPREFHVRLAPGASDGFLDFLHDRIHELAEEYEKENRSNTMDP